MNWMIGQVIQQLLCVLAMRKIRHFIGKFNQNLSTQCGAVKLKLHTGPGYWFLWKSWEIWFPKFTDNYGIVSSKMHLKAVAILKSHWNNVEKNGTFSLFETSVDGSITFAYIMTFHCNSAQRIALPGTLNSTTERSFLSYHREVVREYKLQMELVYYRTDVCNVPPLSNVPPLNFWKILENWGAHNRVYTKMVQVSMLCLVDETMDLLY